MHSFAPTGELWRIFAFCSKKLHPYNTHKKTVGFLGFEKVIKFINK